ncbi:hypothetical protein GA0070563_11228 [Micromonospora carbonacea]|uniref:Uncharacterized protein n=1 Tax=Micromonospora carbonacea TaxID=47853 RepID=A0A1C5A9V4_9ACTN|nr:hypothetical protein GA0070563_11228 [Micromonospora carbonacea]
MTGSSGVCPECGDPWIGGPGCTATACAWTCGDPDHGPEGCDEDCWNPLATQRG